MSGMLSDLSGNASTRHESPRNHLETVRPDNLADASVRRWARIDDPRQFRSRHAVPAKPNKDLTNIARGCMMQAESAPQRRCGPVMRGEHQPLRTGHVRFARGPCVRVW